MAVVGHVDAFGRHRNQLAVAVLDFLGTVHGRRAGNQLRWIDHVPRTARMHDQSRVRQLLHQRAGTTGVIQMHVGQDHIVDRIDWNVLGLKLRQQARHRIVRTDIDKGGVAALDDQMAGVELRTKESGVDRADAVVEVHTPISPACRQQRRCLHRAGTSRCGRPPTGSCPRIRRSASCAAPDWR